MERFDATDFSSRRLSFPPRFRRGSLFRLRAQGSSWPKNTKSTHGEISAYPWVTLKGDFPASSNTRFLGRRATCGAAGRARLGDFGLCGDVSRGSVTGSQGTRGFWAPEQLKDEPYIVTSCNHCFCMHHEKDERILQQTCPGCNSHLPAKGGLSVARYRIEKDEANSLNGLQPDSVLELASNAIAFWVSQERTIAEYEERTKAEVDKIVAECTEQTTKLRFEKEQVLQTLALEAEQEAKMLRATSDAQVTELKAETQFTIASKEGEAAKTMALAEEKSNKILLKAREIELTEKELAVYEALANLDSVEAESEHEESGSEEEESEEESEEEAREARAEESERAPPSSDGRSAIGHQP